MSIDIGLPIRIQNLACNIPAQSLLHSINKRKLSQLVHFPTTQIFPHTNCPYRFPSYPFTMSKTRKKNKKKNSQKQNYSACIPHYTLCSAHDQHISYPIRSVSRAGLVHLHLLQLGLLARNCLEWIWSTKNILRDPNLLPLSPVIFFIPVELGKDTSLIRSREHKFYSSYTVSKIMSVTSENNFSNACNMRIKRKENIGKAFSKDHYH